MAEWSDRIQAKAAICYACGHDNILGTDICEECGQSLSNVYMSWSDPEAELSIFLEPIETLNPRQPVCVHRRTSLAEVVTRLKARNVGAVLVTDDNGELMGIFSEGDAHYKIAGLIEDLDSIPVESLMTPRPSALKPEMPIGHALHLMGLHGFRHVPLVDEAGKPVGCIVFRDIVHFIEEHFALES